MFIAGCCPVVGALKAGGAKQGTLAENDRVRFTISPRPQRTPPPPPRPQPCPLTGRENPRRSPRNRRAARRRRRPAMNPSSCFRKRTEDAGQVAAKRAVKNVTAEPPCDKLKTGVTM